MKNLTTTLATPTATRIVMPALRQEKSAFGALVACQMAVRCTSYAVGARVPAFIKDVALGVRAWSPPV